MRYYIWSHRHNQWWRPNHHGYVNSLFEAGQYSKREAVDIVFDGLPGSNIAVSTALATQLPIPIDEVKARLEAWRRM